MIPSLTSYSYFPLYKNFGFTSKPVTTTDVAAEEIAKDKPKFKIKKYSELSDKQKKYVLYTENMECNFYHKQQPGTENKIDTTFIYLLNGEK